MIYFLFKIKWNSEIVTCLLFVRMMKTFAKHSILVTSDSAGY